MLLETSSNKRLHQLELLRFSCRSLRGTDWQTAVHTGWEIWGTGSISCGKVHHQSTASQQPAAVPPKGPCWGCVTSPCGAVRGARVFSERQAAKRGTRDQRKYLCTSAFLKVCFFTKDRRQGRLFNLFGFNLGSFFIGIKCHVVIVLLSEYFLED